MLKSFFLADDEVWRLRYSTLISGENEITRNSISSSAEMSTSGHSLQKNLQSRLFEERPWFGGKRKTMDTLMYRLGLIGRIQYLPVNDLSDQHLNRFWTLMLAATKTRVFMLDHLLPLLDEISMSFLLEWMESFPGSIIVFGEHANILNTVESRQDKQMALSRSLFDLVISFTSYGEAKTLINNQKKFIDDK